MNFIPVVSILATVPTPIRWVTSAPINNAMTANTSSISINVKPREARPDTQAADSFIALNKRARSIALSLKLHLMDLWLGDASRFSVKKVEVASVFRLGDMIEIELAVAAGVMWGGRRPGGTAGFELCVG